MADSDGEYVGDMSDDELADHQVTSAADGNYGTRSKSGRGTKGKDKGKGGGRKAAWEDIQRSWEDVVEAADGTLKVNDLAEAEMRRRVLRDTTPFQRGIIRHLMLVLDMSSAMTEKDYLPSRYRLTLSYAVHFVQEYFEQNPISQLGVVGMRDGIAVRISDMSGNPAEHIEKLSEWMEQQEPQGYASLQNALEMCRGALFHAPSHGTREVLIIYGALMTSDPGDIHDTISNLVADRIRVSMIGLAAQVFICSQLCARTNAGDKSYYSVALHEVHFRELFLKATTPPVTHAAEKSTASLLMMGFPSRATAPEGQVSLCACHSKPSREGYTCTRCLAKVCRLPTDCPICGLTLILSTHLARSYHHLFPLRNWVEVSWADAVRSTACHACLAPFPPVPPGTDKQPSQSSKTNPAKDGSTAAVVPPIEPKGVSESGRYACQVCNNHFCIDCDVFAHETIHNCPGCQSDTRATVTAQQPAADVLTHGHSASAAPIAMDLDT